MKLMLDTLLVNQTMNVIAKDAEMKLGDMKETIGGFKFLNAAETKKSMESGNLDKFLKRTGYS